MIGLLRYAFLRGRRDGTLITLLAAPTIMVSMPAIAVWLSGGKVPMPPADVMTAMILFHAALMGSLAAFMAFRSEIATRSLGTFVLAAPSWLIPIASTIYGWIVGTVAATLCAVAMFATGWSVPSDLRSVMVNMAIMSLAAASAGTMGVLISSSFSTVAWIFTGLVVIIGIVHGDDTATGIETLAVLLVALVAGSIAVLIVERRCAT